MSIKKAEIGINKDHRKNRMPNGVSECCENICRAAILGTVRRPRHFVRFFRADAPRVIGKARLRSLTYLSDTGPRLFIATGRFCFPFENSFASASVINYTILWNRRNGFIPFSFFFLHCRLFVATSGWSQWRRSSTSFLDPTSMTPLAFTKTFLVPPWWKTSFC